MSSLSPDVFSWNNFSRLLGRAIDDPVVSEFLLANRLDGDQVWRPVNIGLESEFGTKTVDTKKLDLAQVLGVKLQSKSATLPAGHEDLGSKFVLSSITYFAAGEDEATQFTGILPAGLTFSNSVVQATDKVGLPTRESGKTTDGRYFFRSWNLSGCVSTPSFRCDLTTAPRYLLLQLR